MEYTNETITQCFVNLIEIYSRKYDLCFHGLAPLEVEGIKDGEKFDSIIKKINRLRVKENRILERLDSSEFYHEWTDVINEILNQVCGDDDIKKTAIDTRLQNVFDLKEKHERALESFREDLSLDDEYDDGDVVLVEFSSLNLYAPLQISFLRHLKQLEVSGIDPDDSYLTYDILRAQKQMRFFKDELRRFEDSGIGSDNINYRSTKRKIESLDKEIKLASLTRLIKKSESMEEGSLDYIETQKQITTLRSELRKYATVHEECIYYKYFNSIVFPDIESELILARYNPDNIELVPDELRAEAYKQDLDEYLEKQGIAKETYADACFQNLMAVVSRKDFDVQLDSGFLKVLLEENKFSLTLLNTEQLVRFAVKNLNGKLYEVNLLAESYFNKLVRFAYKELFTREDYEEGTLEQSLEYGHITFDEDTYDNLFKLVDISKEIYDTFALLYMLETEGYKETIDYQEGIEFLSILTEAEKALREELCFDSEESDAVDEIIGNHLAYAYANQEDNYTTDFPTAYISVKKRILNILFDTVIPDMSLYKDETVPYHILKNYQLECAQAFNALIGTSSDPKEYLRLLYTHIASSTVLTDEFIVAEGDIDRAIVLDDESMSMLLGIDADEYEFDKEGIASVMIQDIVDDFTEISSEEELSSFEEAGIDYQTIALDIAFGYSDQEQIDELQASYQKLQLMDGSILYSRLHKLFSEKEEKPKMIEKKRL